MGGGAGGDAPPPAYQVFAVTVPEEKSLEYAVEQKKKKSPGSEFVDEAGRHWKLVCTCPTEEEALKRKAQLEEETLCWGAFRMVKGDGTEAFEVKRIPKGHPKKFKDKYGRVWHLGKKCPTEEKAEKAIEKMREKHGAAEPEGEEVSFDK